MLVYRFTDYHIIFLGGLLNWIGSVVLSNMIYGSTIFVSRLDQTTVLFLICHEYNVTLTIFTNSV